MLGIHHSSVSCYYFRRHHPQRCPESWCDEHITAITGAALEALLWFQSVYSNFEIISGNNSDFVSVRCRNRCCLYQTCSSHKNKAIVHLIICKFYIKKRKGRAWSKHRRTELKKWPHLRSSCRNDILSKNTKRHHCELTLDFFPALKNCGSVAPLLQRLNTQVAHNSGGTRQGQLFTIKLL